MKIKADEEGKQVIQEICDYALKAVGLRALNLVNIALSEVNKKEEPNKKPKEKNG